jgi:hypothetical protein
MDEGPFNRLESMGKVLLQKRNAKRRLALALKICAALGALGILYLTVDVDYATQLAKEEISDRLRIDEIEVVEEGSANLSRLVIRDDVVKASGIRPGREILKADLDAAAKGISSIPWIKTVSLSKRLPSQIRIEYTVHNARAIVVKNRVPWLVTAAGVLIAPASEAAGRRSAPQQSDAVVSAVSKPAEGGEALAAALDLPVIQGDAKLMDAMAMIDALERDTSSRVLAVHEVRPGDSGSLEALIEVNYGDGTVKVTLKTWALPTPQALARLRRVLDHLVSRRVYANAIDLRPGKKVVVSLAKET